MSSSTARRCSRVAVIGPPSRSGAYRFPFDPRVEIRVVRGAAHAAAPLGVVVTHPDLVVDRAVPLPPLDHPARVGPFAHRAALAVHAEEVLVEVAAERPPDHVVVEDPLPAFFRRVAL